MQRVTISEVAWSVHFIFHPRIDEALQQHDPAEHICPLLETKLHTMRTVPVSTNLCTEHGEHTSTLPNTPPGPPSKRDDLR